MLNPACSCRAPGQSWAEALQQSEDQTIERGDIVVTEERARQLSQPRFDAQGKPINADSNPARQTPVATKAGTPAATAAEEKPETDPSKRKVRAVGPAFLPEH